MDWNEMPRGRWTAADTRFWVACGRHASEVAGRLINNNSVLCRVVDVATYSKPDLKVTEITTAGVPRIEGETFPRLDRVGDRSLCRSYDMRRCLPELQPTSEPTRVTSVYASEPCTGVEIVAAAIGLDTTTPDDALQRLAKWLGLEATVLQIEEIARQAEREETCALRMDGGGNHFLFRMRNGYTGLGCIRRDGDTWQETFDAFSFSSSRQVDGNFLLNNWSRLGL